MRLAEPLWLVLLALTPLPWLFVRLRPKASWPTLDGFGKRPRWSAALWGLVPVFVRVAAIVALVIAIARPQTVAGRTRIAAQGVSIVVVLDQSSSMNTEDFPMGESQVTRLRAAKETLAKFVGGRRDDLIGLVVFANYPDTACPLTLDHAFLLDAIRSVRTARPGDDGTNLGDAIVWSVDSIKDSPPKKKVIILLTDGRNAPATPKPADPVGAARIARRLGVTIHTIAIGKPEADTPKPQDERKVESDGPDFAFLERLAETGGGRAFVAADFGALDRVFETINTLEKSPVRGQVRTRYREDFGPWAAAALGLLAFDRLIASGRLRRLP